MSAASNLAEIEATLAASRVAAAAGNKQLADDHWRHFIGLIEFQMGRTGSPERLTPSPKKEDRV